MTQSQPDRKLLRPNNALQRGTSATICGLVPKAVKSYFSRSNQNPISSAACIDPSGIAYMTAWDNSRSRSRGRIYVWEHVPSTLQEPLVLPSRWCVLEHPEYGVYEGSNAGSIGDLSCLTPELICLCPYSGGLGSMGGSSNVGGTSLPSYSLLACSPNGVVCLWSHALHNQQTFTQQHQNDDDENVGFTIPPCASVRLPLDIQDENYEYVTSIDAAEPAGFIVVTNRGRLWILLRQGRELHAKELIQSNGSNLTGDNNHSGGSGVFGAVGRMLFRSSTADAHQESKIDQGHTFDPVAALSVLILPEKVVRANIESKNEVEDMEQVDSRSRSLAPASLRRPSRRPRMSTTGIEQTRSFIAVSHNSRSINVSRITVTVDGQMHRSDHVDASVDMMEKVCQIIGKEWDGTSEDGTLEVTTLKFVLTRDGRAFVLLCRTRRTVDNIYRFYLVSCSGNYADNAY